MASPPGSGDGRPPQPADPSDEPAAKKPRTATGLLPEAEYAQGFEGLLELSLALPNDESANADWNLKGQTVTVQVPIGTSMKDLKNKVSSDHLGGMPPNKFQLRSATLGFLKDRLSAAHYNLKNGETLQVSARSRGGR